jgi:hypothetical protein
MNRYLDFFTRQRLIHKHGFTAGRMGNPTAIMSQTLDDQRRCLIR